MNELIRTIQEKDPASPGLFEVIFSYPGFHIFLFHRLSHWLWGVDARGLARFISHLGRFFTGIEIHPGAVIGKNLFIDHGMGVVIGETAEIGDNVLMYHGVTLGGGHQKNGRRHAAVGNDVMIGAGAKLIGGITVGDGAKIGANAVVTKDVPSGAMAVGVPARIINRESVSNE